MWLTWANPKILYILSIHVNISVNILVNILGSPTLEEVPSCR